MTAPTATTRQPASRGKPDQICADAVDLAREAVTEDVAGAHIEAVAEGERVVTHYFECAMPAYRGWRWAVTVARVPRGKLVTVCETVLLPGPDALVTPDWVPWEDRVAPGDLGVGDLMPTAPDDERLAPGYLLSDDPVIEDVVWELGLGRVRVLSRLGRLDTAERWYEGDNGPGAPISTSAPTQSRCVTCGFYLPLAGSMRALFGACANMYAPDDGRVVSADHGCGAHSETLVEVTVEVDEAPTVYDDGMVDRVEPEPSIAVEAEPSVAAEAEPDESDMPVTATAHVVDDADIANVSTTELPAFEPLDPTPVEPSDPVDAGAATLAGTTDEDAPQAGHPHHDAAGTDEHGDNDPTVAPESADGDPSDAGDLADEDSAHVGDLADEDPAHVGDPADDDPADAGDLDAGDPGHVDEVFVLDDMTDPDAIPPAEPTAPERPGNPPATGYEESRAIDADPGQLF